MSFSRATVAAMLLASAGSALAAEPELGLSVARAFGSQDTDVLRLTYRSPIAPRDGARWWPQQLQLGASIWRVPDLGGITRRFDLNVTPVWRSESAFGGAAKGYLEAGLGAYLLSHTINNDNNRLPSALEFGSHLGAGLQLDPRLSVGLAVQHISNAGLKQPNGGINLYMLTASYRL
jgi:lipid A 3-O-deacylase PagL